ncbi:MAG: hypothetical protein JSW47_17025, partial [Phycisphaerales bacterium]
VLKNREEFERLRNDMLCIRAMSEFYAAKARAAMFVLRYQFSKDATDMKRALGFLEESLEHYRILADLTADTYDFANSLQMGIRKIPFTGSDGRYKHWTECMGEYAKELKDFRQEVESLISVIIQVN